MDVFYGCCKRKDEIKFEVFLIVDGFLDIVCIFLKKGVDD